MALKYHHKYSAGKSEFTGALDLATQADDPAEQRAAYRLAALGYKFAYLLRNIGVTPDLEVVGDMEGAAFAYVVEEQVSRLL